MAEVERNEKELAMKGNLPASVMRSMTSGNILAKRLLKGGKQVMGIPTDIIYDMLKSDKMLDLDSISGAAA